MIVENLCLLSTDVDRRRLRYLGYNIQQDLAIEAEINKRRYAAIINQHTFMEKLVESRNDERIQCNMLLLLLVVSVDRG